MDIQPGIPVLGPITKALEQRTSKDGNTTYQTFTVSDYFHGYVNVRVFGNLNDKIREHLSKEGAVVLVNAESVAMWNPTDDQGNVKRFSKGARQGQIIVNMSATANGSRIRFVPVTTTETPQNSTPQTQPSSGDTVRGGDDSAGRQPVASQAANRVVDDPWG